MVRLTDRVVRLRAPNPSVMTLDGTNTYIVAGAGKAAVIDPGPAIPAHIDAIIEAAAGLHVRITAILVTHGHPDHAPGAALLHERTGAPVYAHALARFPRDRTVAEGDVVAIGDAALHVVDAPGHARDHLVFWLSGENVLFTGDVVIGRGTVVVAPPGGDMRDYQATLARLRRDFAGARSIFGGHGERIDEPRAKLDEYIAHRIERERGLLEALAGDGPHTVPALVGTLYRDTDPVLWPAAARQVMAYLDALEREGRVRSKPVARPATADESAMLHPDLSRIADAASRRAIADELDLHAGPPDLREYELVGAA